MSTTRPIVLVDQDEVLGHWQNRFNKGLTKYLPHVEQLADEKLVVFEAQSLYPAEHAETIQDMMNEVGFYLDLDPVDGAVEALNEMQEDYEVFICSSPYISNPTCASEKFAWIEKHIGKDWKDRLILTRDKTLVYGEILIDDKPVIEGVNKPAWTHIAFPRPYNVDHPFRMEGGWANWRQHVEAALASRGLR